MVTISDIAKICGVSKATVSRVINNKPEGVGNETRARIQKVIDELDYRPNLLAQGIATSKTRTIGLILPNITNPFFPKIVSGVENYASKKGYTVILGNTDDCAEKENEYISTFIAKRIDGVLLTSTVSDNLTVFQKLHRYNIPCVLLDRALKTPEDLPGVFIDNRHATNVACEELISHGNRDIAFISGPAHLKTSQERLEGFSDTLESHGIPFNHDLLKYGDFSFRSGYATTAQLISEGRSFTAIMASNDAMAIGAMKALKEKGIRIPDSIEVIGFDNIEMCELCEPTLTTIDQPTYKMGRIAAEMLFKLIDGKSLKKNIYRIQPRLIIRNSTRIINL